MRLSSEEIEQKIKGGMDLPRRRLCREIVGRLKVDEKQDIEKLFIIDYLIENCFNSSDIKPCRQLKNLILPFKFNENINKVEFEVDT